MMNFIGFRRVLGNVKIYEKIAIAQLIESWNNDQNQFVEQ
jgi:hypothetical protein